MRVTERPDVPRVLSWMTRWRASSWFGRTVRPEHEERFQRIVNDYLERPGGDYAELLNRGRVSSPEGVDAERWRERIRAQARRDKIAVVTFRDGDRAFAVRQRHVSDEEVRYELDRMRVLMRLAAAARELGHEPGPWLRHDQESIALCSRCDARIYVGIGATSAIDGEQMSEPCPRLYA